MNEVKIRFRVWQYRKWDVMYGAALLLVALPVLLSPYYPTLDGPAHACNANMLRAWFTGEREFLSGFLDLNYFPNPNLISHIILGVLGSVTDTATAEKWMVFLCVMALPLSFRYLLLGFRERLNAWSFLIFPLTYSFPLLMGFFNFSLALSLMFSSIGLFSRLKQNGTRYSLLFLLVLLFTYLSHLFVFGITVGILFLIALSDAKSLREWPQKLFPVFLMALPGLVLSVLFLLQQPHVNMGGWPDAGEIAGFFKDSRSLVALHTELEAPYVAGITILLAVLFVLFLIRWRSADRVMQIFFLTGIGLGLLCFVFPDWMFGGGYLSIRLHYFCLLMLSLAFAMKRNGHWMGWLAIAVVGWSAFGRMSYYSREAVNHGRHVDEFMHLSSMIPPRSTALILNYETDWFLGHFTNYAVIRGDIIIFENYEAETGCFPLRWKPMHNPKKHVWDLIQRPPCGDPRIYERVTGQPTDYIMFWKYPYTTPDSCAATMWRNVRSAYEPVAVSSKKNGVLLKRR
ncbi:MAG: hypothetical protein IT233_00340 [Bacteroidia bacterium]|nr:hypothetical protein [Bacteroidia bacterium]